MRHIFLLLLIVTIVSCSKKQQEQCAFVPETGGLKLEMSYASLEDTLPAVRNKEDVVRFFSGHATMRDVFFSRPGYPNDSVFINELYRRFTNKAIDTLLMETHRVFGDGSALKTQFAEAFRNMTYYYPQFHAPKVETVITGLEADLFVSDSLIMVGLDYYLGDGARYRPAMYDYMLRRYNKNFIVPSVVLLFGIDRAYNKTNLEDKTALAEMVTYGKAYYFAKQMLPCVPDSVFIGYTADEMAGSRKYENLIWSRLVEDEVLYSTSHQVKQKFISERPKTLEVGEKCPGRIATWIGWQIVKRYMDTHPDVTLPQLMALPDAEKIFKESGYKPQIVQLPKQEKF